MAVDDIMDSFSGFEPTLITQPPNYPEEQQPQTDDFDGMLDHLLDELDGRTVLEKPRVSKKTMVYALKQQAAMIKKLKTEAASNFLLLDYRSRRTAEVVEKMAARLSDAEAAAAEASRVTAGMDAALATLSSKLIEMDQTAARVITLEEQVASLLAEADRSDKRFVEHCERTACSLGVLETRTATVEATVAAMPGEQVLVPIDDVSEPQPLPQVLARLEGLVADCKSKMDVHGKALRLQAAQIESKADISVEADVVAAREDVDDVMRKIASGETANFEQMQKDHASIAEQLDTIQADLLLKVEKGYLDARVEAKYEEIIGHLQKALTSSEEDEGDFKKQAKTLQDLVEALSSSKADRRELLDLKQFVVSLTDSHGGRRRSSSSGGGDSGLTGNITRDEVFNLLEEKIGRRDLERRLALLTARINALARGGKAGGGAAGTPAQRGGAVSAGGVSSSSGGEADAGLWAGPDPEGALAMTRQLTDCMGKPVHMAGPAIGTCLSCKAPIVHPDRQDLYPAAAPKGGGFQLWSSAAPKGPPMRGLPGDVLPGLDLSEGGRHVIGKDGVFYLANGSSSGSSPVRHRDSASPQRKDVVVPTPQHHLGGWMGEGAPKPLQSILG